MNNYCENCGKELVNGECPNCRVIELRKKLIQNNQIYENPKKRREHEKKLKQEETQEEMKSFKRKIIIDTIKKILTIIFVCYIIYVIFLLIMGLLAMQACADFVNTMG